MKRELNNFLEALAADGKSPCTISAYKTDLQAFLGYCERCKIDLGTCHYADLREWANGLEKSGLAATSRARKISAVKSFSRYLHKMEKITQNPAADICEIV